jgi:hypothetical protein
MVAGSAAAAEPAKAAAMLNARGRATERGLMVSSRFVDFTG